MVRVNHRQRIYSLYRGEVNLGDGTRNELAEKFNIKPKTITYLASPAYRKKIESPGHDWRKSMVAIVIGYVGEDFGWKGAFR